MGADARLGSIRNYLNSGRPSAYVHAPAIPGTRDCSLILAAFLWLVRTGLFSFLDAYGFWPYMALCGVLFVLTVCAAFAWDWYEARR